MALLFLGASYGIDASEEVRADIASVPAPAEA